MSNRKRNNLINFRVTDEEKNIIEKKIKTAGMGKERYLRNIAMDGMIYKQDIDSINRLAYEINKIGINVNQIAKHVNQSRKITINDMEELQKRVGEIWQLLKLSLLNRR